MFDQREVLSLSGLALVAGTLGLIIHGGMSTVETPILENQFLGLWFALMFGLTGLELLWLKYKPIAFFISNTKFLLDLLYFSTLFVSAFICMVCYAIAGLGAAVAWSVLTGLLCTYSLAYIYHRRREAIVAGAKQDDFPKDCKSISIRVCNNIVKFLHFAFAVLLIVGGITAASIKAYPMPGVKQLVKLTDGRTTNLHVYCTGPKNASQPTIWLIADAAHGVVDFYGIQFFLNQKGRRVCTQDNPGFGWSDPALGNTHDYQLFYDSMFEGSGEQMPMVLVGWGGGGSQISAYYQRKPENIAAMIFLSVFSPGIEFEYAINTSLTSRENLKSYKQAEMSARAGLGNIILGLALPWGLMPVFVPEATVPAGYYPPEKRREFRVQLWSNSMWVNQVFAIKYMASADDSKDSLSTVTISKPFTHILCKLNETQICNPPNKRALGDKCEAAVKQNNFYFEKQIEMTQRISNLTRVVFNTDADCDLNLPVSKPQFVADSIEAAVK